MALKNLETAENRLDLWRGEFGNAYRERNAPQEAILRMLRGQWAKILSGLATRPADSILEVGANLGLNLRALRSLTDARLLAVEPNDGAVKRLIDDGVVDAADAKIGHGAAIPFADGAADLVFTSGVMIHIHLDDHVAVCREMHRVARRYIACVEYFSDLPREIPYRGHSGALFLRDFGSLWMDTCPQLVLRDYGFFWRRAGGADSMNWWLFEKPGA